MKTGNHIFILKISIASILLYVLSSPPASFDHWGGTNAKKKEYNNFMFICSNMENITNLDISSVFAPAQVHNADRGKNVAEFGIK